MSASDEPFHVWASVREEDEKKTESFVEFALNRVEETRKHFEKTVEEGKKNIENATKHVKELRKGA